MKYCSKAAGMAVFIGMVMAGGFAQGAERSVSTVDSQELFRSRMVSDNKAPERPDVGQAVDDAVANLPRLNSRLRWAAVKSSVELAEEEKAVKRQTKAIPIIITAADMDKERKAKKKGEKEEKPALISPRPIEPPKITPAPAPVSKPAPVKPPVQVAAGNVTELPPIQPIGGLVQQPQVKPQEIAELPPVVPVAQSQKPVPIETIMDAIVEATSIELVVHEVKDDSVELPAVQPVK